MIISIRATFAALCGFAVLLLLGSLYCWLSWPSSRWEYGWSGGCALLAMVLLGWLWVEEGAR